MTRDTLQLDGASGGKQEVFGWFETKREPGARRFSLWAEFRAIQREAGIKLPCYGNHEHTESCQFYGFHDLRRACATLNADRLTATALQRMMRHKSFTTTQRYINMAPQLKEAAEKVWVPMLPATRSAS